MPSSTCDFNQDSDCPYKLQRDMGKDAQICNTNFAYIMSVPHKMFGKRELLIVDEAHSIPNWALEFAKTTINLSKKIEGEDVSIIDVIPEYSDFEEYLKWFGEKILPMLDARKGEILETSYGESSENIDRKSVV
jgi:Rad3-related DNA helicase